jgi:organic hydroperoxide reductase OsmC/OhrA
MAILEHRYTADVTWNGGREGNGSITPGPSGQGFPINVPPEFGGEGGHHAKRDGGQDADGMQAGLHS